VTFPPSELIFNMFNSRHAETLKMTTNPVRANRRSCALLAPHRLPQNPFQ
jgi:hypothetical protein